MFRTLTSCLVIGGALLVAWVTLKASLKPPKPAPVYYLEQIPSVPYGQER